MLANWVKATTTTTGTGTLTLSAVTGYPRPNDTRSLGTLVQYSILTSDGSKEAGIGRLAASNTLERVQITATYASGTYNHVSPSALSLPSGTHDVIITPMAAAVFEPALFPLTVPSNYNLPSAHLRSTQANTAPSSQRQTAYPFLLQTAGVLTAMTVNVATLGAGSSTLLALYEVGADGGPDRQITVTTAAIDTSTTGFKSQAVTQVRLSPGWYWVALCVTAGSAPSFTGAISDVHAFGLSEKDTITSVRIDAVATTLDNPFPASSRTYSAVNSPVNPYIGLVLIP